MIKFVFVFALDSSQAVSGSHVFATAAYTVITHQNAVNIKLRLLKAQTIGILLECYHMKLTIKSTQNMKNTPCNHRITRENTQYGKSRLAKKFMTS